MQTAKIIDFLNQVLSYNEDEIMIENLCQMLKSTFAEKEELENVKDSKASQEALLGIKYASDMCLNDLARTKTALEESRKELKITSLELETQKIRLQNKADIERVLYLQNLIEEYTPLDEFNMLMNSIPEYAK